MIDMKLTSDQSPASMMLGTQPTEANGLELMHLLPPLQ